MDGASGDDGVGADWASEASGGEGAEHPGVYAGTGALGLGSPRGVEAGPGEGGAAGDPQAAGDYGERELQGVAQSGGSE